MWKYRKLIWPLISLCLVAPALSAPPYVMASGSGTAEAPAYAVNSLQSDLDSVLARYQAVTVSVVSSKDLPHPRTCGVHDRMAYGMSCILGTVQKIVSRGSGFVVRSDGTVVTNKHVVSDTAANHTVIFGDKAEVKAESVYRDPSTDIAVLKVPESRAATATLGDSDSLRVGQFVVAVGNSLGEYPNSASFGIVSGLGRSIASGSSNGSKQDLEQVIQTDAAINPGNSGGPLINMKGEVVGMVTAKSYGADNVGFALPVNTVKTALDRYYGSVTK